MRVLCTSYPTNLAAFRLSQTKCYPYPSGRLPCRKRCIFSTSRKIDGQQFVEVDVTNGGIYYSAEQRFPRFKKQLEEWSFNGLAYSNVLLRFNGRALCLYLPFMKQVHAIQSHVFSTSARMVVTPEILKHTRFSSNMHDKSLASWVCFAAGGQRPRKKRTWKTNVRRGTVSQSQKLVKLVKTLSNVKDEVYSALDSFIAWQVQFPLITIKKALKSLEQEREWKRIVQVCKWMLEKGQGKTLGTYFTLLNALIEEERIEEAEELWNTLLFEHQEFLPKTFFSLMIRSYQRYSMTDKIIETFADMEELGITPDRSIVLIVSEVFKNIGMMDKYEKVLKKYPEKEWQYRYQKGKKYKILVPKSMPPGKEAVLEESVPFLFFVFLL
eukprot:TRINITY_DN7783_c0_g1_i8.p1 TRINITY_DN7783_c0_g1~~TRINITY_DN7783_c0_g1_i8.p1  ORF type:complete len:382 (-),score=48.24 TRINITY_DN7783_c0_g1_i8:268-1413(-)